MKISKLFAITLQSKIRFAFLVVALFYNFILGFYLKTFLVLSQTLTVFYLLSILACLFLIVEIKTKAMRIAVYISLILIACMNIAYAIYCRRVFPFLALLSLVIVFMYFIAFNINKGKDRLLTKIFVLVLSAVILFLLYSAYIFVYKQENVSLTNGQATLWNTKTVELAVEICADCEAMKKRLKQYITGLYIISSMTMNVNPLFNTLMFVKHLKPEKESAMTFPTSSQHSAAVKISLVMWLMVIRGLRLTITTLGTEFIWAALGGKLILHLIQRKLSSKVSFTVFVK